MRFVTLYSSSSDYVLSVPKSSTFVVLVASVSMMLDPSIVSANEVTDSMMKVPVVKMLTSVV